MPLETSSAPETSLIWSNLAQMVSGRGETLHAPIMLVFISGDERGRKSVCSFSHGLGNDDEEDREAFIFLLESVLADLKEAAG